MPRDNQGAEFAGDRREAEDSLLVFDPAQRAVRGIDLAGAIHLFDQRAKPFRLALCGLHDGARFFESPARDTERRRDLVAGLAPVVEIFHHGLLIAALQSAQLPRLCKLSFLFFDSGGNRDHLARREILAVGVLGELAARNGVNVDHMHGHVAQAGFFCCQ
jgi:hypothetical protein